MHELWWVFVSIVHQDMDGHARVGAYTHTIGRDSILVHSEPCGQRGPAFPVYSRQSRALYANANAHEHMCSLAVVKASVYCWADVTST